MQPWCIILKRETLTLAKTYTHTQWLKRTHTFVAITNISLTFSYCRHIWAVFSRSLASLAFQSQAISTGFCRAAFGRLGPSLYFPSPPPPYIVRLSKHTHWNTCIYPHSVLIHQGGLFSTPAGLGLDFCLNSYNAESSFHLFISDAIPKHTCIEKKSRLASHYPLKTGQHFNSQRTEGCLLLSLFVWSARMLVKRLKIM